MAAIDFSKKCNVFLPSVFLGYETFPDEAKPAFGWLIWAAGLPMQLPESCGNSQRETGSIQGFPNIFLDKWDAWVLEIHVIHTYGGVRK